MVKTGITLHKKKSLFGAALQEGADAVEEHGALTGFLADIIGLLMIGLNALLGLALLLWPFRSKNHNQQEGNPSTAGQRTGDFREPSDHDRLWVLLDSSFRYADMSPSFGQMLGFSRSELIGRTAEYVTPPDFVNFPKLREEIRSAGRKSGYWVYRRRDGRFVLVRYDLTMRSDGMADLYLEPLPVAS